MTNDKLTATFAALANPTRRAILERLTSGQKTVTELAEPFDMTMPAISKHLKVLEEAELIERSREAQFRPVALDPTALRRVDEWMDRYRQFYEGSFARLDEYLAEIKQREKADVQQQDGNRDR